MTAAQDTREVMRDLERIGVSISYDDAQTLRRAQITLHRWAELECGTSGDYASWVIERDDETNIPYLVTYPHRGEPFRRRIADRETGALKRIVKVCAKYGLHYYHQGDPRGCALRISTEPMTDGDYTRGICV
jgi:hypothetical protein